MQPLNLEKITRYAPVDAVTSSDSGESKRKIAEILNSLEEKIKRQIQLELGRLSRVLKRNLALYVISGNQQSWKNPLPQAAVSLDEVINIVEARGMIIEATDLDDLEVLSPLKVIQQYASTNPVKSYVELQSVLELMKDISTARPLIESLYSNLRTANLDPAVLRIVINQISTAFRYERSLSLIFSDLSVLLDKLRVDPLSVLLRDIYDVSADGMPKNRALCATALAATVDLSDLLHLATAWSSSLEVEWGDLDAPTRNSIGQVLSLGTDVYRLRQFAIHWHNLFKDAINTDQQNQIVAFCDSLPDQQVEEIGKIVAQLELWNDADVNEYAQIFARPEAFGRFQQTLRQSVATGLSPRALENLLQFFVLCRTKSPKLTLAFDLPGIESAQSTEGIWAYTMMRIKIGIAPDAGKVPLEYLLEMYSLVTQRQFSIPANDLVYIAARLRNLGEVSFGSAKESDPYTHSANLVTLRLLLDSLVQLDAKAKLLLLVACALHATINSYNEVSISQDQFEPLYSMIKDDRSMTELVLKNEHWLEDDFDISKLTGRLGVFIQWFLLFVRLRQWEDEATMTLSSLELDTINVQLSNNFQNFIRPVLARLQSKGGTYWTVAAIRQILSD